MGRLVIALALAAAAVIPATAHAGGWATVVLAPPPAGLDADDTWAAELTVLRHGRTPTDGALPYVTIRSAEHGTTEFAAKPTGKTGVYVAQVKFPGAGTWKYEVSDGLAATGYGYSTTHTYSPVEIVPATGAGGGNGVPAWPFALAALAVVAAAVATLLARQRGRRPAIQS